MDNNKHPPRTGLDRMHGQMDRHMDGRSRAEPGTPRFPHQLHPKEVECFGGDQLQLPLPSPSLARAPSSPNSWRIFKLEPSDFGEQLQPEFGQRSIFKLVLTSGSCPARLDLLITFPRHPGSGIEDLENICHCNNVISQPSLHPPSHYSRTF